MTTVPVVPTSVWEQIPVIIIFAILLGCIGYVAFKSFTTSVADINRHYAGIVEKNNEQFAKTLKENNEQWRLYFDSRSENSRLANEQFMKQISALTEVVQQLATDFRVHDEMERQALDVIGKKQAEKKNRNAP